MQTSLTSLILMLGIFGAAAGCVSRAEVDALRESTNAMRQELTQAQLHVMRIASQAENMEREWYSERFCRSEKPDKPEKPEKPDKNPTPEKNFKFAARINEFITQVQASVPSACTEVNMESSMNFMHTQAYANTFYSPGQSADVMHPARREYLLDMVDPKRVHPSTRFLVLVQPAEETEDSRHVAMKLGEEFRDLVKNELAPKRELRLLGPHLLPCRMRKEIQRLFNGPMDVTLPKEPKEGQPRVRVWLLRTDC